MLTSSEHPFEPHDAPSGFSCLSCPSELSPSSNPNVYPPQSSGPAPAPRHSPKTPCSAIFSGASLCRRGSTVSLERGVVTRAHMGAVMIVSPSPCRGSDRDCLNSILSRGRVPWQLHKYLPAAAAALRLGRARLQATSTMFFFCPFSSIVVSRECNMCWFDDFL